MVCSVLFFYCYLSLLIGRQEVVFRALSKQPLTSLSVVRGNVKILVCMLLSGCLRLLNAEYFLSLQSNILYLMYICLYLIMQPQCIISICECLGSQIEINNVVFK